MVSLHLVDSTDVDLIAALRGENLPEPGAGRYFSADHYGAVIGYVGLEGPPRRAVADRALLGVEGGAPGQVGRERGRQRARITASRWPDLIAGVVLAVLFLQSAASILKQSRDELKVAA